MPTGSGKRQGEVPTAKRRQGSEEGEERRRHWVQAAAAAAAAACASRIAGALLEGKAEGEREEGVWAPKR